MTIDEVFSVRATVRCVRGARMEHGDETAMLAIYPANRVQITLTLSRSVSYLDQRRRQINHGLPSYVA